MRTIDNFINEYRNAPVKTKNELVVIIEDLLNNTAFDPFNITTDNSDIASKTYVNSVTPTLQAVVTASTISSATVATGDKILIQDIDDSDNVKTITAQSIADLAGGGLSNIIEDTTPQLGGNLDLNGNNITGSGTINVTGSISVDNLTFNGASIHGGTNRVDIQTEGGDIVFSDDNAGTYLQYDASAERVLVHGLSPLINNISDLGFSNSYFDDFYLSGEISTSGTRVTQAYFTNHTTTNAETVDSDMRLKDEVSKINNALDTINLFPQSIEYTWKPFEIHKKNKLDENGKLIVLEEQEVDTEGKVIKEAVYEQEAVLMDSETSHYGFSAQELKSVQDSVKKFPKLVREHGDGYLHVAYSEITPILVKAVQELSAKVKELEEKIK